LSFFEAISYNYFMADIPTAINSENKSPWRRLSEWFKKPVHISAKPVEATEIRITPPVTTESQYPTAGNEFTQQAQSAPRLGSKIEDFVTEEPTKSTDETPVKSPNPGGYKGSMEYNEQILTEKNRRKLMKVTQ
jgi:hypothetical protein